MHAVEIADLLSGIVVVSCCLFLIGLATLIAVRRPLAERFLAAFASSARAHYTEQLLRLLAGAAMVNFAPLMWYSGLFSIFGWFLVVTAAGLLLIPWQWHRRFGTWAIPLALRRLNLIAVCAAALGAFILYAASRTLIA